MISALSFLLSGLIFLLHFVRKDEGLIHLLGGDDYGPVEGLAVIRVTPALLLKAALFDQDNTRSVGRRLSHAFEVGLAGPLTDADPNREGFAIPTVKPRDPKNAKQKKQNTDDR